MLFRGREEEQIVSNEDALRPALLGAATSPR